MKAWKWFIKSYESNYDTIFVGLAASTIAWPISYIVASTISEHTNISQILIGWISMGVSMIVWDILYSFGLYYFFDRKELIKKYGHITKENLNRQVKKYFQNCCQTDCGWIVSYQGLYALGVMTCQLNSAEAVAFAHGLSILLVDLLRPPILKLNKTLVRDQFKKSKNRYFGFYILGYAFFSYCTN